MNRLFHLASSLGGVNGRRRLWLGALIAGFIGLVLAGGLLLVSQGTSEEDRARSDGYVTVGTQAGDTLWAKVVSSGELSVISTGRDGTLCNGTGPDTVGSMLCSSGVAGQASIVVMVAPANTAQVRLETIAGSLTLKAVDRIAGMKNVLTFGVFPGDGSAPLIDGVAYVDANGNEVAGE